MERNNRCRSGFTLPELIGSIAILGGVAGFCYVGYVGVSALRKYVNAPEVERANVIGGPEPELYMERDRKYFCAEIDGMPVEEYLMRDSVRDNKH